MLDACVNGGLAYWVEIPVFPLLSEQGGHQDDLACVPDTLVGVF